MTATLITHIGELVTNDPDADDLLGTIADAAVVVEGAHVAWVGTASEAPAADEQVDAGGRAVIPGFVDSHSHLVFAGDRAAEFAARMAGESYAAGGIRTTVAATRAATDEQLTSHVAHLVAEMRRQGTTTVEIKSGYGLTVHDEARSLAVARQFTEETTFLGAHVVPADSTPEEYVALVTGPMLDACAPHARWVDAFCETGAFDADQSRAVLEAGAAVGLRGRLHANQLGPGPGVRLACELGLTAVDHCTYLTDADVTALADSGTIATLLPGCRVLDAPALSRRAPAPRRRCAGRPGIRLQPGLVLHQLASAVRRARRPRDGDDSRRGTACGDRGRRRGTRPRRRRPSRARQQGRPGAARRPHLRPPRLPPRRPPGVRHLGRWTPRLIPSGATRPDEPSRQDRPVETVVLGDPDADLGASEVAGSVPTPSSEVPLPRR